MRLDRNKSHLLIVDMQERMVPTVRKSEQVTERCLRLIRIAQRLEVGITLSEQYPTGLGRTIGPIGEAAADATRIGKLHFSCWSDDRFRGHLRDLHRSGESQIVIAGVETHVCLGLTVLDLLANGFETFVVGDAVSARSKTVHKLAIERMRQAGARILDSESVLFEWLQKAGTPEFKELIKLIK